jgi:hypothetical protein
MSHARFLLIAALAATACKGKPVKDPNAPADAPAVIATPPVVIPADTMGQGAKAAAAALIPPDKPARERAVMPLYSMAAATMVHHDARMLSQVYAGEATLTLPESTVTNLVPVVRAWIGFAKASGLSDFQRISDGMKVIDDSTLADSGRYMMVMKRSPRDSVFERGRYASTIRARTRIEDWVILSDHIIPANSKKKK